MNQYTATRTVNATCSMSDLDFDDFVETAGYGINYWCDKAVVGVGTYTIHDAEEDKTHEITANMVCNAILSIAYAPRASGLGGVHMQQTALDFINDRENVDYDADWADVVVQVAAFGKVVYG